MTALAKSKATIARKAGRREGLLALVLLGLAAGGASEAAPLSPSTFPKIGTVDERYQSYNVEMLEVTGGRFWKPYADIRKTLASASSAAKSPEGAAAAPAGMSPDLYQYRPPIDLTNRRLRTLARALGPAYVRISGTWANTTFFTDAATPPKAPPKGYGGVLTRQQWLGAINFSRVVDAPIVTSVPNGAGTRGADGLWRPDQARHWLAFTTAHGGTIAAAEYFNEPTLASMGGAPKGYDAAAFGRDFKVYDAFMRKEFPAVKLLAPGSVGEANAAWAVASGAYGDIKVLPAEDLAASTGDADAFSYHHYGAASERCAAMGHQTSADQALSEDWLGRTDQTLAYYRAVRDKAMPGKPFWNTETADAACGGNPWAGAFLDTFRYLDQLGRLARQEVKVVIHNTLASSDYGLLDEHTYEPKPNYWAALLWRRLMGTVVLDAGPSREGLHLYAQCLRGQPGGVALLAINNSRTAATSIDLPGSSLRYTLMAGALQATSVNLNGQPLRLLANDRLPALTGRPAVAGRQDLAPLTITFFALPNAANTACAGAPG
jgi:heparanase 1